MQNLAAYVILNSCFQYTWGNFDWEKEGNASEIEEAEKTTLELFTQQHCRPVLQRQVIAQLPLKPDWVKDTLSPYILITASFMQLATWCMWLLESWRTWSRKWANVTAHLERELGNRRAEVRELQKQCFLGSCYCVCSHWQGENDIPCFLNNDLMTVDN